MSVVASNKSSPAVAAPEVMTEKQMKTALRGVLNASKRECLKMMKKLVKESERVMKLTEKYETKVPGIKKMEKDIERVNTQQEKLEGEVNAALEQFNEAMAKKEEQQELFEKLGKYAELEAVFIETKEQMEEKFGDMYADGGVCVAFISNAETLIEEKEAKKTAAAEKKNARIAKAKADQKKYGADFLNDVEAQDAGLTFANWLKIKNAFGRAEALKTKIFTAALEAKAEKVEGWGGEGSVEAEA